MISKLLDRWLVLSPEIIKPLQLFYAPALSLCCVLDYPNPRENGTESINKNLLCNSHSLPADFSPPLELNWKDIDHHRNSCQNMTLTLAPRITEWEGDVLLGAEIQSPEKMGVKQDCSTGLWHRPGCEDTRVLGPAFWKMNVFLWTSIPASLQRINDKACLFRKLLQPGIQGLVGSRDACFL